MTPPQDEGRPLVNLSEIARIAGVRPSAVSNWRVRSEDFPSPASRSARADLFDLAEVMAWLRANDKDKDQDGESLSELNAYLWRYADQAVLNGFDDVLAASLLVLAALRFADWNEPADWADLDERDVVMAVRSGLRTALVRGGITHSDLADYEDRIATLVPGLPTLVAIHRNSSDPRRLPGLLIDGYMSRFGKGEDREYYTATPLRRLIADLAAPLNTSPKTILDPACGTGGLLATVASAHRDTIEHVYGNDLNPTTATMTRARMAAIAVDATITAEDALRDDPFRSTRADVVVCDPPFGIQDMGLPGKSTVEATLSRRLGADLMWAALAADTLTEHGRAVITMPTYVLTRTGVDTRTFELLRRGVVQAVIELPNDSTSRSRNAGTCLLVLRSPSSPSRIADVVFIDATDPETWDLTQPEAITALQRAIENVTDPVLTGQQAATCVQVPLLDLLAPHVPLSPAYWAARSVTPDMQDLQREIETVNDNLARSQRDLVTHAVTASHLTAGIPPQEASIGSLIEEGRITFQRGSILRRPDLSTSGVRVITNTDITQPGTAVPQYIDPEHEYLRRAPLTEPGDVIFSPLSARAIVDETGGATIFSGLEILRQDPKRLVLPPAVLAAYLSTPAVKALATGFGPTRVNVRQVQIPLLAPDDADALSDLLDRLARTRRDAESVADLSARLADLVTRAAVAGLHL